VKLYSGPISLFTAKVRVALAEKGLAYDRVEVGWTRERRYEPHHPDVVALNPKRQVPILVDGDLVVYDSTLILEYLEERYPETPLYPRNPADRARCRQLEAAADEIIFEPLWTLIDRVFYPGGQEEAETVEGARAELAGCHAALEKELAGREYLCAAFSVADIGNFVMLSAAAQLGSPPDPQLTNLTAWFERIGSRPAVQQDSAEMIAFVAGLQ
jgi:glutathione S-transferase